jgi:sRNA-binding regulator protein Hfq
MKTKTIFHNVSRTQLEFIITNGVKALADSRNFDSFVLTIETEGDSQSIKIIEAE